MIRWLIVLALAWIAPAIHAGEAQPWAPDPALEARVIKLSESLRCLVCQNQSIAESHAALAVDLRNQVREMMKNGRSDQDIIDFMVQRYGDFVLFNPPVKATTLLLWYGPLLVLLGGGGMAYRIVRRRREVPNVLLDEAERARALVLLQLHSADTQT